MTTTGEGGGVTTSPDGNVLLAAWPGPLPGALRPTHLEQGRTVQPAGAGVAAVYFPVTAVLAVAVDAERVAHPVEVHHLGREGVTGAHVVAGDLVSSYEVSCAATGAAWTLPVTDLIAAAEADGAVGRLLQRYLQAQSRHVAQRVACSFAHTNDERFAAAILTTAWQTRSTDTVELTQTDLARMLLVRRATVSASATRLADAGAIRYRYGTITIADRAALDRAACPCHRTNHEAYLAVARA